MDFIGPVRQYNRSMVLSTKLKCLLPILASDDSECSGLWLAGYVGRDDVERLHYERVECDVAVADIAIVCIYRQTLELAPAPEWLVPCIRHREVLGIRPAKLAFLGLLLAMAVYVVRNAFAERMELIVSISQH